MRTDHLPFPMPERKHSLNQNWKSLTFMHWEVSPDFLRKHLPDDLEIDLFEGKAYVGTIPFRMERVRPRFLPPISFISNFPEFNIRTYVKKNGKVYIYKKDGLRRRRRIRGNVISQDTRQINLKVVEVGKRTLGSIFGLEEDVSIEQPSNEEE